MRKGFSDHVYHFDNVLYRRPDVLVLGVNVTFVVTHVLVLVVIVVDPIIFKLCVDTVNVVHKADRQKILVSRCRDGVSDPLFVRFSSNIKENVGFCQGFKRCACGGVIVQIGTVILQKRYGDAVAAYLSCKLKGYKDRAKHVKLAISLAIKRIIVARGHRDGDTT